MTGGEVLGIILIFLIVFFIGREILLWYWKVNETVHLLKQISFKLDKLESINDKLYKLIEDDEEAEEEEEK